MTTQPHEGGRRPIDRVLAPGFADGLSELSLDELRERRQLAEQEEADLSYARRLLQGRMDLLRAELASRTDDGAVAAGTRSDEELARDLAVVLADGPRTDHGLGRHITTEPSRVGEHRRAAEQAVDDVQASDPASLPDAGIAHALTRLGDLESSVSESRHQVQAVMDVLTTEVGRRYREGEANVEDVLAAE
jgi:hypothetical protein